MNRLTRFGLVLALALAVLALAVPVAAVDSVPDASPGVDPRTIVGEPTGPPLSGDELDRRTNELASTMRCPVCQALSVADSPTTSALAMKEEIRDLLASGFSEAQVLEYFETSYGEFILLAPKKKGLNWLVWLSPVAVLAIGAVIILGRRRRGRASLPTGPADDLADYADRVRQEVEG